MIKQCHMCATEAVAHKEPMIAAQLPTYPWQMIGSDLFELNGTTYMLVVDYFSRYIEVVQGTVTSLMGVIEKLKPMFSRQGIPEFMVSDNGPQYSSHEMKEFAQLYGFIHITSSPRYPKCKGQAERAVQTVKKLLRTSSDLYLSVLNYMPFLCHGADSVHLCYLWVGKFALRSPRWLSTSAPSGLSLASFIGRIRSSKGSKRNSTTGVIKPVLS